jgi:hypothetical protein
MATIYISSTFNDLKEHRLAAYRILHKAGHKVVAMEDYVAIAMCPLDRCLGDVAACDIYVGIFAWRYGYIPNQGNPERRSITELEYRKAAELGKPRLIFLIDPAAAWPRPFMDIVTGEGERGARVNALRAELGAERLVSFFASPDQLASLASAAVQQYEANRHAAEERARQAPAVRMIAAAGE